MNKIFLSILIFVIGIPSFASNPWDSLLINDRKVTINFNKQSPAVVNNWFTKACGIIIITDPNFNKPITLISPVKMNISDCFSMYSKILEMHNYEIVKEHKWLVIKQKTKVNLPIVPDPVPQQKDDNDMEIKVIKLRNNNASNVSKIINEIFTPTLSIDEILKRINTNDPLRPSGQNRLGNN